MSITRARLVMGIPPEILEVRNLPMHSRVRFRFRQSGIAHAIVRKPWSTERWILSDEGDHWLLCHREAMNTSEKVEHSRAWKLMRRFEAMSEADRHYVFQYFMGALTVVAGERHPDTEKAKFALDELESAITQREVT